MKNNIKNEWKKWLRSALFVFCGFYTFATILNSILYLASGIYEDPNGNWHELDRAVIVLIGVVAFELLIHINLKSRILKFICMYIPTLLLAFGYIWLSGLREALASSAYHDIFINYSSLALCIGIGYNIVDIFKKNKAGKNEGKYI